MLSWFRIVSLGVLLFALVACKSNEEKAEEYYQSGVALLEQGDVDRALVELRNVLQFDGGHREARRLFAQVQRERGDLNTAYRQYLRLVEQYPEDADGRIALSFMAFEQNNWDEFGRHGEALVALQTDLPEARAVEIGLDYRNAVVDEDASAWREQVVNAQQLSADLPENTLLQAIKIDGALRDGDVRAAIEEVDAAIVLQPEQRQLYDLRLQLLGQLNDREAIEEQLQEMTVRFPDDNSVREMLVRYYVGTQQLDKAEDFMRNVSSPQDEDPGIYLSLIQFLAQSQGSDVAIAELDAALSEETPNEVLFRATRASLKFDMGEQEEAIAEMQAVTLVEEPTPQINDMKVILSRMLLTTGNEVGARRLIEEVLALDPTQVDALKMRAAWMIEADDVDQAITTLRTALDQSPRDDQAMTLMANAYVRSGRQDLATDYMSLAVDASGNAPAPSLRYAAALMSQDRLQSAEDTLLASLRVSPNNVDLLSQLGRLYLRMDDLGRLEQVVDTLARIGGEEAVSISNQLRVELLSLRTGPDEAIDFLQSLALEGTEAEATRATVSLIVGKMRLGQSEEALELAQQAAADQPENLNFRLAHAAVLTAMQDWASAEEQYRYVLERRDDQASVWLQLMRIQSVQGQFDEARATLDEALEINPLSPDLLWSKASFLEQDGDIDGAIEVYEGLYERSSNSLIVANNLASLLATWRDDEESLERAYRIARRLRSIDTVPAFQDTYGWIAYRRGDIEEALEYLEPAAEGLPDDPIVQYHLGMTYSAADRAEDAKAQFQKVLEIAGDGDTRPQIVDARQRLGDLP